MAVLGVVAKGESSSWAWHAVPEVLGPDALHSTACGELLVRLLEVAGAPTPWPPHIVTLNTCPACLTLEGQRRT